MSLWWLLLAGQAVTPGAMVGTTFDLATVSGRPSSVLAPRCEAREDEGTDVVVCGGARDRYRLPLPVERPVGDTLRDLPGGTAAITPSGPCGIFAGERRCRNADKAVFGYGRGRDPVTLLSRLATKAANPDAD